MTSSNFPPRLIFMGTPDFSLSSLKALMESGEKVISVYTQPDRPKGRGRKLAPSPIKEAALSLHLPVFQPVSFKESSAIDELAEQKPDLLIVVAYGLILPQRVLDIPTWGAVNVHASLLPKYRGAAPIQRAIINGEKETGVTTMRLDAGMDTGDILLMEAEPILETDMAQSLHDRLSVLGGRLLLQTLERLRQGTLLPRPQDPSSVSYAPPLKKGEGEIRWTLSGMEIDRWIRGLSPWPGAFTFLNGKRLIIHKARPDYPEIAGVPGTVNSLKEGGIQIQTGQGILTIFEAQLEGHRRMSSEELLRGVSLKIGDRLGR
ncbi:MAG: methionyl-tRNA formyltransferase [Thermodesulfobacteriota bacterium]